eukprot:805861-Prymnesium_polylepis.2
MIRRPQPHGSAAAAGLRWVGRAARRASSCGACSLSLPYGTAPWSTCDDRRQVVVAAVCVGRREGGRAEVAEREGQGRAGTWLAEWRLIHPVAVSGRGGGGGLVRGMRTILDRHRADALRHDALNVLLGAGARVVGAADLKRERLLEQVDVGTRHARDLLLCGWDGVAGC